jgi:hypothetical protein
VTAPSIPNASPPIFDAFGLVGGARGSVAIPSHFRLYRKRSPSFDLAFTQSCEPSHPSASRIETVRASSACAKSGPSLTIII